MKVKNHKEFAMTDYNQYDGKTTYNLGDIVTKKSPDGTEIGVVIQLHDEHELRVDMFGNASNSEITLSTYDEILINRGKLLSTIDMDFFIINYDERQLTILFEGEQFTFNLNDGDVGDFWNTLTTKDGTIKDINFYQETEKQVPSVSLYGVNKVNNSLLVDMNDGFTILEHATIGKPSNYFDTVLMVFCPVCQNWEEQTSDMPRHNITSFQIIKTLDDGNGLYKCSECGKYVVSDIIPYTGNE
jgi:hypothetical protein